MNQPQLRAVSNTSETPEEPGAALGLGASLRTMREARGVSLADASARLKYATRQLEALENEQWSKLPSGVPLRGLVKNYARFLDADVAALLAMLDSQVGTQSAAATSVPLPSTTLSQADLPLHSDGGARSWGWLLVFIVLLVVAGIYAIDRGWIPESWLVFDWLKALK